MHTDTDHIDDSFDSAGADAVAITLALLVQLFYQCTAQVLDVECHSFLHRLLVLTPVLS